MTINNQDISPAVAKFKSNPSLEGLQELIIAINKLSERDKIKIIEDPEIKKGINNIQRNSYENRIKLEIDEAKAKGDLSMAKKLGDHLNKWIKKGRPLKYG